MAKCQCGFHGAGMLAGFGLAGSDHPKELLHCRKAGLLPTIALPKGEGANNGGETCACPHEGVQLCQLGLVIGSKVGMGGQDAMAEGAGGKCPVQNGG